MLSFQFNYVFSIYSFPGRSILIGFVIILHTFPQLKGYKYSRETLPRTIFSSQISYPYNQEFTKFPLSTTQGMTGGGNMASLQNDTQNDSTFNKVVYFAYGPAPPHPPPPPRRRRLLAHFLLGFTAGSAAIFGGAAAAGAIRG